MKKLLLSILLVPFMLGFSSYVSVIHAKQYKGMWKHCGGCRISDCLYFSDGKIHQISWPYIYKEGKLTGYAIVCIGDRFIAYSIEDKGLCEYIEK